MMLQIDKARQLVDELLKRGWSRLGHQTYDTHPYYMAGPFPIAIGQNIRLNPKKNLTENIESYFKRMMSRIIKYNVKKIVLFSANNGIPLPQHFKDFCNANGIKIEVFEGDDDIEDILKIIKPYDV